MLKVLPDRWEIFRAFFGHLFDGDDLKHDITADDVLGPLKGKPIGETYGYALSRLAVDFPEHFRSLQDVGRVRGELARLGIDPMQWAVAQAKSLKRSSNRFVEEARDLGDIWTALQRLLASSEFVTFSNKEQALLDSLAGWAQSEPGERKPLIEVLTKGHASKRADMRNLVALLLKLPPGRREHVLAFLDEEQVAPLLPLDPELTTWLSELAHDPKALIRNPAESLMEAAELIGVDDVMWFTQVYLAPYARAMTSPTFLIDALASLPMGLGLVAPPLKAAPGWPALIEFFEVHDFERNDARAWYEALVECEPAVDEHLAIAFASRLRPYYETARKEAGHRPPYEDLLARVGEKTGLEPDAAHAWLAWEYAGNNRKEVGKILREHTMMLDWAFTEMRGLRKLQAPTPPVEKSEPKVTTKAEHVRVLEALRALHRQFTPAHPSAFKLAKLMETLSRMGLAAGDVVKRLPGWVEDGLEKRDRNFILAVLTEAGAMSVLTEKKTPPVKSRVEKPVGEATVSRRRTVRPEPLAEALPGSGHELVDDGKTQALERRIEALTEIIEAPEDHLGVAYERFSAWIENLGGLVAGGNTPMAGVQRLEEELRAALKRRGVDLDALMKKQSGKGGGGESGGSSPAGSTPSAPPASVPPASMPQQSPRFIGALAIYVPVHLLGSLPVSTAYQGILLRR